MPFEVKLQKGNSSVFFSLVIWCCNDGFALKTDTEETCCVAAHFPKEHLKKKVEAVSSLPVPSCVFVSSCCHSFFESVLLHLIVIRIWIGITIYLQAGVWKKLLGKNTAERKMWSWVFLFCVDIDFARSLCCSDSGVVSFDENSTTF